jgi:hypothetical protein
MNTEHLQGQILLILICICLGLGLWGNAAVTGRGKNSES